MVFRDFDVQTTKNLIRKYQIKQRNIKTILYALEKSLKDNLK